MSILAFGPKIIRPSWQAGFARDSANPVFWRGLVGAWIPALGPTGLTLRDVSGRGNHGTLTTMDPPTDWVLSGDHRMPGYTLDYEGDGDHVAIPNGLGLTNPFTILTRVNIRGAGTVGAGTYCTIVGYASARRLLALSAGGGKILAQMGGGNLFSATNIALNTWYTMGYQWDGVNQHVIIDGKIDASAASASGPSWENAFRIGDYGGANYLMNGQIGTVAIWNYALPAALLYAWHQDPLAPFRALPAGAIGGGGRTTYNTDPRPLGVNLGMSRWLGGMRYGHK